MDIFPFVRCLDLATLLASMVVRHKSSVKKSAGNAYLTLSSYLTTIIIPQRTQCSVKM